YLVGGALRHLDPLYAIAPAWGPRSTHDLPEAGRRLLISSLLWGGIALACGALAAWRLRPVYIRELESLRPQRDAWYAVERPPVEDDPVRWRESNVEGLAPNPTLRSVPRWLAITLIASLTTLSSLFILGHALFTSTSLDDAVRALALLDIHKLRHLMDA